MRSIVVLLTAGTLVSACEAEHPHPTTSAPLPTVNVRVQTIAAQGLQGTQEVVGTVRAKLRATLEAKVSGRISRMPVRLGDRVKSGQLVAELDVAEVKAKFSQAEAVYHQAKTDRDRFERLRARDAVTPQEFEATNARYEVAKANLQEARSILDYAKVRAPFAGRVTHKLADVGDLASPGRPLIEIEDPTNLQLEVAVPEALSRFVGIGAPIPVRMAGAADRVEATVSEIAPAADPNSRTLLVKLDLPSSPDLRAGQFGRASIPTGRTQVLRLPERAILRRGSLEIVFVADEGRAKLRLVKTGKRFDDMVEVVSGLESGESVVVEGARSLADGQPIEARS